MSIIKPNPFDSFDREAAARGGSEGSQRFTAEHLGRRSVEESSGEERAVLMSPNGIGQSEMVGFGRWGRRPRTPSKEKKKKIFQIPKVLNLILL